MTEDGPLDANTAGQPEIDGSDHNPPPPNPLDPALLTGLDLPADRLLEVAREFGAIRTEIEKLRQLNLEETHPAIVFRPVNVQIYR